MSKFKGILEDLNIDEKFTKRINRPRAFNKVKDNVPLHWESWRHMMCRNDTFDENGAYFYLFATVQQCFVKRRLFCLPSTVQQCFGPTAH